MTDIRCDELKGPVHNNHIFHITGRYQYETLPTEYTEAKYSRLFESPAWFTLQHSKRQGTSTGLYSLTSHEALLLVFGSTVNSFGLYYNSLRYNATV
jgi:hypothetical protein